MSLTDVRPLRTFSTMDAIPALLIVEGDVDQLVEDGISKGVDRLEAMTSGLVSSDQLRVTRVRVRNDHDLEYVQLASGLATFNAVLLVAHGNPAGAQATHERFLSWEEIASLLAPTRPDAILALTCMGASSDAARALFAGIPSLQLVGGSPTTLSVAHADLAFMELIAAAYGLRVPAEVSMVASILNGIETGGVVGWRRRESFTTASAEQQYGADAVAIITKTLVDIAELSDAPQRQRRSVPRAKRGRRSLRGLNKSALTSS